MENNNYLDGLSLDSPLSVDKIGDLSPLLEELSPHSKSVVSKPSRRGRKRNAEKMSQAKVETSSSSSGEDSAGLAGLSPPAKPKRGRGRPAGSTNRSNKTAAAAAAPIPSSNGNLNMSSGNAGVLDPNDPGNAARERSRVKTLRDAFLELQRSLPSVPPDTKLSKLDVLVLATTYISHLMRTLDGDQPASGSGGDEVGGCTVSATVDKHHRLKANGYLHPVKLMRRARLERDFGRFYGQREPTGRYTACGQNLPAAA
ncbi:uncharacterized protein [Diadema antillarum]|uniref:uncharacterized protein n=1 Tax=Diadema antillarum TaxID=105358 RepID=UPI003A84B979